MRVRPVFMFIAWSITTFGLWYEWVSEPHKPLEKAFVESPPTSAKATPGDAPHRTLTTYQDGEQMELPGVKDSNGEAYEINVKDLSAVVNCGLVATARGRVSCVRHYVSPWHHHRQKQDDVDTEV